jgi:hypothetical protein
VYPVYGSRAELKMRRIEKLGIDIQEIVQKLYGTNCTVHPLHSCKWSFNAMMGRLVENVGVPEDVAEKIQDKAPDAPGLNEAVRESAEIVANVDKGFVHYISKFRNDLPVSAAIGIEKGHHSEYGWGVYFEQGRHRCVLAGTVVNRPEEEILEDTTWKVCAEWANFEPVLGQPRIHRETLWEPDESTHIFEGSTFDKEYANASEHRKRLMERFAVGTQKFAQVYEFHTHSDLAPSGRVDRYAYHAASSRRVRIADCASLWEEGRVVSVPPRSQNLAGTSPSLQAILACDH